MRLYELAAGYEELLQMAEEGLDADQLALALDAQLDAIEQKGGAICKMLATLSAEAEALKGEELRLQKRRKAMETNVERLREYLRSNMQRCGITRIKSDAFSVTLSDGPQRVVITDPAAIPPEYLRVRTISEPNKPAILDAYKAQGECVSGTAVERSTCLTIR
jgi:hypothetical protein